MLETSCETSVELSIVIPCLNEVATLETCIRKAQRSLNGIAGEVIVADNGSTDGSVEAAERLGVRIVQVTAKGYGSVLMAGITAARGKYVVMGDADDSYDFLDVLRFLAKLREGYDLVQGCRLPAGGGTVAPGAMPWSHRWIGNPGLSFLMRRMFHVPVNDVYCGMRGFRKDLFERLNLQCTGMEFATEMILKSALHFVKYAEVPITLHRDGRVAREPHLRTIRDGWRTLRLYLMFSPRSLFGLPGLMLMIVGLVGFALALAGVRIGSAVLGAHSLLFASCALLMGYQALLFEICAKTFAVNVGLLPRGPAFDRFYSVMNLERGLVIGATAFLAGAILMVCAVWQWRQVSFGALDYSRTMRWVVPGVTLASLGFQTMISSFLVSILGLRHR